MTLSEIRLHLQELGVRPSRRLGQNFLYDQNVASRIVELAMLQPESHVLEIGPGLGAITEFITHKTPHLTVIEKDHRLADFLKKRFTNIQVIQGDALKEILHLSFSIQNYVVVGNLPYSVASPLIVEFCEKPLRPQSMLFTIQLEVAERLVAQPNTHDYGLLTLLTQPFYEIKIVRKIPATVFWPQPEVASAVILMTRRMENPFVSEFSEKRFRQIIKQAFQQRRKTLRAIFGKELPSTLPPELRPEAISPAQWIAAANAITPIDEFFDVVDSHDLVVDQQPRRVVHRDHLWHRAIHIFIWNQKGELLLQKRSAQKDVAPCTWDSSVAGHLAVGESYEDAARREMEEEVGISEAVRPLQKFQACEELGWEFIWLYDAKSEGPFSFPEDEISEVRWFKIEEVSVAMEKNPSEFAPSFRFIWLHWKRQQIGIH